MHPGTRGTHVAGIAAGNGRASNGRYRGVAYESELIVVKLGVPRETSFPKTTELMSAVDFCIARARQYGKPIAFKIPKTMAIITVPIPGIH